MISFTEAQAQALVTDPGTLKRGQELRKPSKWSTLGRTDTAAWGECAGSGAKLYLTGIDLSEPAFKCSCPSRVFPCKHGAGLLLLLAERPGLFGASSPPNWLAEWLEKRQEAQEKKAEKSASKATAPTTENKPAGASQTVPAVEANEATALPQPEENNAGQALGLNVDPKRLARMVAGAEELVAWLEDLMRAGLASVEEQPARFWESQAARLVDNQLPGLAATLRELADLRHAYPNWPSRLLARLGELFLLARAFQNIESLASDARQEVLQQVGVNLKKEDLFGSTAPVTDTWLVLGQYKWEEERLTARRTWLRGRHSGRTALVLEFVFGSQPFATPLVPRGSYKGDLAFYPGLLPLRAAPVSLKFGGTLPPSALPPAAGIAQLLRAYAKALALQPWLREWPATLAPVLPTRQPDGSWHLRHLTDPLTVPLRLADEDLPWQLLAESGGAPLTVFGEWDGQAFRLLSHWIGVMHVPTEASEVNPEGTSVVTQAAGETTASALSAEPLATMAFTTPTAWPQLLRVALLGTRQSGEVLPPFPSAADTAEQQLLLSAGTLALMRKAGHRPVPAAGVWPAPALPETWEPLGRTGAECLRALLAGNRYTSFRTSYLEQLQQHRRLIPPALLVPVLNHEAFRLHLPGPLAAVLGERGRWVAQQNPDWQGLVGPTHPSNDLSTWETGTLRERRFFIQLLHQSDPEQARKLLAAALPTEPAASQAALLSELEHYVSAADASFLEPFLNAKSKEVRQTVVPLLVRLPNAALVERLWQRAATLITLKRPLSGKNKLEITLPETWDKSWQADGIEQKDSRFEGGERAAWLGQLLTLLPPSRWAAHLLSSPEELLTLAETSEWARLLFPAWARASYLHRDKAFATGLLQRHFAKTNVLPYQLATHLTWVLSEDEKFALLRAQLPAGRGWLPFAQLEFFNYLHAPWPADIVEVALRTVAEVLAPAVSNQYSEPHQRLSTLLFRLAEYVPAELIGHCIDTLREIAQNYPIVYTLVEQFIDSVQFRQQLTASLTEPAT